MLFDKITPESAGISSSQVKKYLAGLEKQGMPMHSVLMMKGDSLFCECYFAPYNKDSLNRMYSQTKSFVSMAIGLLIDDGKLRLDDKIVSFFQDKINTPLPKYLEEQTIRDMLTMCTVGGCPEWFGSDSPDRAYHYFNAKRYSIRPSGTEWDYDSAGSQMLSILVERLTGKRLFDFLYERLFSRLGTFNTAKILSARGGDSWGDSALLCTSRDMLSFARLLMNLGSWGGEQLISKKYVKEAISKQVSNRSSIKQTAFYDGYGYQIWRTKQNGFAFVGMGNQLTVCLPEHDLIFTCTADCQGDDGIGREYIINSFFELIVNEISSESLAQNDEEYNALDEHLKTRKLFSVQGIEPPALQQKINGITYECAPNRMEISSFRLEFADTYRGILHYTNAQGDKALPFGINYNEFGKFPQLGYSTHTGGVRSTDGSMYNDAVSGAWLDEQRLLICVQIIDEYLGNLAILFSFKGDEVSVKMEKCAEDFLNEYYGTMIAKMKK